MGWVGMLEPQTRAALTDLLHPPAGFALSHAVGTTFTLDLDTALMVPLSFAARRLTADDEPLGILDAARRAADRVDIFAQAGQIGVDLPPSDLVAFLEPMVHPVAINRGIFHPKVWFLEFERGDERSYRFICASRNLTADRSWDVVVSLDGTPVDTSQRDEAAHTNAPLVALLRWLPQHTVAPLPNDRAQRIVELADRWATVEWEAPSGMHDVAFHVWGLGPPPRLALGGIRGLFISPFLTDDGLSELKKDVYHQAYLLSRGSSIDSLDQKTINTQLRKLFVLDDAANPTTEQDGQPQRPTLSGLHAKTYLVDQLDGTHVFIGSLNATGPALHDNVEVMVEAVGSTTKFGVEKTLEALGDFIQEYEYTGGVTETDDEAADRKLGALLGKIAAVPLHARVVGDGPFSLEFWRESDVTITPDVDVSWHPISRTGIAIPGLPGREGDRTLVPNLALTDITPFVVVVARDTRGERKAQRTVVLAQLHDDPADRRDAIIASHLTDRNAFLRFLMLLLELGGGLVDARGNTGSWGPLTRGVGVGSGLFEALLRAVGPGKTGLADVDRVVSYLQKGGDRADVLPPGFQELWDAVWTAQQRLTEARNG